MRVDGEIERLRRARPRDRVLRGSLAALGLLVALAWTLASIHPGDLLSPRALHGVARFARRELVPHPMRAGGEGGPELFEWVRGVLAGRGLEALGTTLAIAVLASVIAGLISWLLGPLAARTLSSPAPYDPPGTTGDSPHRRLLFRAVRGLARLACILLRALPEYVLAFLFVAVLGPRSAWPLVLALALHNGGILGRLGAETIENLDPEPLVALRRIGAQRGQLLVHAVFPLALGRSLLYFFYRFETQIREASVLGMLGVVSLGYWVEDARANGYHDELLVWMCLGAALVLAADLASALARGFLRGAR